MRLISIFANRLLIFFAIICCQSCEHETYDIPPPVEELPTFIDERDGNTYSYIQIGNQTWMAENLRYLPQIDIPPTTSSADTCYYVFGFEGTNTSQAIESENYKEYGVLYNWQAALASCPAGWHLPSEDEWDELINYCGGEAVAGGILKEKDTVHWISPNTSASDLFNFTARPGGEYLDDSQYHLIGQYGYWWTSTELGTLAVQLTVSYNAGNTWKSFDDKAVGFSVRCIKD